MNRGTAVSLTIVFVLCAGCGGSGSAASGTSGGESGSTVVRLERPSVVGARYRIDHEQTQRTEQTTSLEGSVLESESENDRIRFAAEAEVLAISGEGDESSTRYTITRCERRVDDSAETLLRPGQVVVVNRASRLEDASVTIDGTPASPELIEALDSVFHLTIHDEDEDSLFGTSRPRTVGEAWTPDMAAIAASLRHDSPVRLDPSHMHGEARIVERTVVDGVAGARIQVTISADHVQFDGLPDGATIREGTLTIELGGFFPDDVTLQRMTDHVAMDVNLEIDVPTQHGSIDLHMVFANQSDTTSRPIR